jgi:hypothetical protein
MLLFLGTKLIVDMKDVLNDIQNKNKKSSRGIA